MSEPKFCQASRKLIHLQKMNFSVVIPNYNGKILLEKNLPEVFKAFKSGEIIVVDDGSTDGSIKYLREHYPQVKLIEKVTNSGFATAVNLGVKAANGELVMLLNSDAVPNADCLKYALPHFRDKSVFAVGCLDKSIESGQIIERGRGIGKFEHGFLVHRRGEVNKADTLWASGGSSIFHKDTWEKLGGMDEIYNPFYWEDIDLSYRAQKAGFKIVFEPKSRIVHRHLDGSIKAHYSHEQVKEIAYRNQFIFVWENITYPSFLREHWLWLPYHLLTALMRGDLEFWRGLVAALVQLPRILKKRQLLKRVFLKTDAEVLAPFTHE